MILIVLHRNLSLVIACSDGMQWERGDTSIRAYEPRMARQKLRRSSGAYGWLD
jgi:hypothetical protein